MKPFSDGSSLYGFAVLFCMVIIGGFLAKGQSKATEATKEGFLNELDKKADKK